MTAEVICVIVAMKIHISMETKLLLDTLGRFHTEHRGMVEVKGKGMLDTYWLIAKEGGITALQEDDDDSDESGAGDTPAYMKDITEISKDTGVFQP